VRQQNDAASSARNRTIPFANRLVNNNTVPKEIQICACVVVAILFALETAPAVDSAHDFIHVVGQQLVAPGGRDFQIRGIGTGSTAADPIAKDYEDIARLKFNAVTIFLSYRRFYTDAEPEKYADIGWKRLDHGLRVILQMLDVEGAQFVPSKGEAFDYRIWVQPELQERFIKLWEAIAQRYKDEPQILGYGIFCEPVVSGTRQQWIDLATKAVDRIRKIDSNHVLFIERLYGEFGTRREMAGLDLSPECSFFLVPDGNVIYQFYFFERDEYTHQHAPWREDRNISLHYPERRFEIVYREAVNDRGRVFPFDKNYLKFYIERQLEFGSKHKVPMFVWSFGLLKNCFEGQGGLQWLQDTKSLFDDHGLHWSYAPYRADDFGISDNPEALRILASPPKSLAANPPLTPALLRLDPMFGPTAQQSVWSLPAVAGFQKLVASSVPK
jgi:endoglucanase